MRRLLSTTKINFHLGNFEGGCTGHTAVASKALIRQALAAANPVQKTTRNPLGINDLNPAVKSM
jgi:hypothetical protein